MGRFKTNSKRRAGPHGSDPEGQRNVIHQSPPQPNIGFVLKLSSLSEGHCCKDQPWQRKRGQAGREGKDLTIPCPENFESVCRIQYAAE
jgi:hypothetical protein